MRPEPPRFDPQDVRRPYSGSAVRDPEDDVRAARSNVRHAGVTYGPRDSRRAPRDVASDWLHGFVRRYGWRAYALPVLVVLTVAALMTTTATGGTSDTATTSSPVADGGSGAAGPSAPPTATGPIAMKPDSAGANYDNSVLKGSALPAGPAYPVKGNGTFRILAGTSPKVGTGQLYRYSIDVENGISGVDLTQFTSLVVSTLADPRSWSGHGVALQRVDSGHIDFHITLTSSMTVRDWCGYDIPVETSCYQRADGTGQHPVNRVVLNVSRWVRGSTAYVGDLATYRLYMINHEDGHALGHNHAHQCLPGGLAPAMMQQTFGLRSAKTGLMCEANPWPYPVGVPIGKNGAPGTEALDTPQNNEYNIGD